VRSLRGLFPHVAARRGWDANGTPVWEFCFTPRPTEATGPAATSSITSRPAAGDDDVLGTILDPDSQLSRPSARVESQNADGPGDPGPVPIVTSRGVQVAADVLWIDEFHHRLDASPDAGDPLGRTDIAGALVDLAADPGNESLHHRVVGRLALAHNWFEDAPHLEISSARIAGRGLGQLLDGVFVWRAEGVRNTFTYVVAPAPGIKDLLKGDLGLARVLIRAACPHPEDALGEVESNLREAISRLESTAASRAAARAVTSMAQVGGSGADAGVVLEVDPDPDLLQRLDQPGNREKSDSERALSEELAALARKVGTASVRKPAPRPAGHPAVHPGARAREAG
jgi:hypothetical protein